MGDYKIVSTKEQELDVLDSQGANPNAPLLTATYPTIDDNVSSATTQHYTAQPRSPPASPLSSPHKGDDGRSAEQQQQVSLVDISSPLKQKERDDNASYTITHYPKQLSIKHAKLQKAYMSAMAEVKTSKGHEKQHHHLSLFFVFIIMLCSVAAFTLSIFYYIETRSVPNPSTLRYPCELVSVETGLVTYRREQSQMIAVSITSAVVSYMDVCSGQEHQTAVQEPGPSILAMTDTQALQAFNESLYLLDYHGKMLCSFDYRLADLSHGVTCKLNGVSILGKQALTDPSSPMLYVMGLLVPILTGVGMVLLTGVAAPLAASSERQRKLRRQRKRLFEVRCKMEVEKTLCRDPHLFEKPLYIAPAILDGSSDDEGGGGYQSEQEGDDEVVTV